MPKQKTKVPSKLNKKTQTHIQAPPTHPMNLHELQTIISHIRKSSTCPHCEKKYNIKDISVLASTSNEVLLELKCHYCKKTALTDIVANRKGDDPKQKIEAEVPLINRVIKDGITDNDILDVRNFLESFDGDFKKLFTK